MNTFISALFEISTETVSQENKEVWGIACWSHPWMPWSSPVSKLNYRILSEAWVCLDLEGVN